MPGVVAQTEAGDHRGDSAASKAPGMIILPHQRCSFALLRSFGARTSCNVVCTAMQRHPCVILPRCTQKCFRHFLPSGSLAIGRKHRAAEGCSSGTLQPSLVHCVFRRTALAINKCYPLTGANAGTTIIILYLFSLQCLQLCTSRKDQVLTLAFRLGNCLMVPSSSSTSVVSAWAGFWGPQGRKIAAQ